MKKEKVLILIGYILLGLCFVLNIIFILPSTTLIWLLGFLMSGGVHTHITCFGMLFIAGIVPYIFVLPIFLIKSKKTFFMNSFIVLIVHLITTIVYTGLFK